MDYRQIGGDLEEFLNRSEVPEAPTTGLVTVIPALTKITIPHREARAVLDHLHLTGFSASYLFDSYEGVVMDVIDGQVAPRISGMVWDLPSTGF